MLCTGANSIKYEKFEKNAENICKVYIKHTTITNTSITIFTYLLLFIYIFHNSLSYCLCIHYSILFIYNRIAYIFVCYIVCIVFVFVFIYKYWSVNFSMCITKQLSVENVLTLSYLYITTWRFSILATPRGCQPNQQPYTTYYLHTPYFSCFADSQSLIIAKYVRDKFCFYRYR